jgi:ribulose-phosphate 3-epimerase
MEKVMIYPSVLSADFSRLGDEIITVEKAGADGIHLDIMDGHFVPNLTVGPVVVQWIRKVSGLPYWAHLMIDEPLKFLDPFRKAGVNGITFHPESCSDASAMIDLLRKSGLGVGVALNPETGIDVLEPVLERIDRVLVLTVHPGFGGQQLLPDVLDKINRLRNRIEGQHGRPLIEVDGGIGENTVESVVRAGADVLIVGNSIFGQKDRAAALRRLQKKAEAASAQSAEIHAVQLNER